MAKNNNKKYSSYNHHHHHNNNNNDASPYSSSSNSSSRSSSNSSSPVLKRCRKEIGVTTTATTSIPHNKDEKLCVIYLLGAPGSGKSTLSTYLAKDFGFLHISFGNIYRLAKELQHPFFIKNDNKLNKNFSKFLELFGQKVVQVIMEQTNNKRLILDGLRAMNFESWAAYLESTPDFIIHLAASKETLVTRLIQRARDSAENEKQRLEKRLTIESREFQQIQNYHASNRCTTHLLSVSTDKLSATEVYETCVKPQILKSAKIHSTTSIVAGTDNSSSSSSSSSSTGSGNSNVQISPDEWKQFITEALNQLQNYFDIKEKFEYH